MFSPEVSEKTGVLKETNLSLFCSSSIGGGGRVSDPIRTSHSFHLVILRLTFFSSYWEHLCHVEMMEATNMPTLETQLSPTNMTLLGTRLFPTNTMPAETRDFLTSMTPQVKKGHPKNHESSSWEELWIMSSWNISFRRQSSSLRKRFKWLVIPNCSLQIYKS